MNPDQIYPAALAILGKNAKLPPAKTDMIKLYGNVDTTFNEYTAAVDSLRKKIANSQAAIAAYLASLRQRQQQLETSTFNLDPKDPVAKQNIAKAQKFLHDAINPLISDFTTAAKELSELDKHSAALATYKSPNS